MWCNLNWGFWKSACSLSIWSTTAIALRRSTAHGRSTSVSSRCPEQDEDMNFVLTQSKTHIMLLEGPPTPLAGPDRPEMMDLTCKLDEEKPSRPLLKHQGSSRTRWRVTFKTIVQTSKTNLAVRQQSLQHLFLRPFPHQVLQCPEKQLMN